MKYLNKKFNFYMSGNAAYEKNYDRIFRKKTKLELFNEKVKDFIEKKVNPIIESLFF